MWRAVKRCRKAWRQRCRSSPQARHGVTGFIVDNQEQAVQAVARLAGLDRQRCRRAFLQRFTARHMAQAYLRLYEGLREQASRKRAAHPARSAFAARVAAMHQEHHG